MIILLAFSKSSHNSYFYGGPVPCINDELRCGISLKNAPNALDLINNSAASFMLHLACQSELQLKPELY